MCDTNIDLSVSPNGVMMAVGDGDHEWIRFESGEWSYESTIDTDEETETLNDLRE